MLLKRVRFSRSIHTTNDVLRNRHDVFLRVAPPGKEIVFVEYRPDLLAAGPIPSVKFHQLLGESVLVKAKPDLVGILALSRAGRMSIVATNNVPRKRASCFFISYCAPAFGASRNGKTVGTRAGDAKML